MDTITEDAETHWCCGTMFLPLTRQCPPKTNKLDTEDADDITKIIRA